MSSLFEFSTENFIFDAHWNTDEKSEFDKTLLSKWNALQEEGRYFKYKFKIDDSKILPGKYRYVAQLNVARGTKRRRPIEVQSMKEKFNPTAFNFTKMDEGEIIFEIINTHRKHFGNYIAINVSPLGVGHCLFLPSLFDCLPQVITEDSLLTAIELFLLSKTPTLRMGFNGLCANASVNHLHFHLYYLEEQMLLETVEVEHFSGPCYVLKAFPSRGFAFQLSQGQDIESFVRNIFKLVNLLQESKKPHNLYITRGSSFEEKSDGLSRNHVRAYVWVRKPLNANEDLFKFTGPALCELFGHLLIKCQEKFDTITEDYVAEIMMDQTLEPFQSVLEQVKEIFLTSQISKTDVNIC